jgi:hypothetical protein
VALDFSLLAVATLAGVATQPFRLPAAFFLPLLNDRPGSVAGPPAPGPWSFPAFVLPGSRDDPLAEPAPDFRHHYGHA